MLLDEKIFFLHENISPKSAEHYLKKGEITHLMRKSPDGKQTRINGIYIVSGLPKQEKTRLITQNAMRIFNALHGKSENVMLSGPTAIHLLPVKNVLYATSTGSALQNTMIGDSFIISYNWLKKAGLFFEPRKEPVNDEKGSFLINIMPDSMLFIQSFVVPRGAKLGSNRLKRSGLTNDDRTFLLSRLVHEHGGISAVVHSLKSAVKLIGISETTLSRAVEFINSHYQHSRSIFPERRADIICHGGRLGQILDFKQFYKFDLEQPNQMLSFIRAPNPIKDSGIPIYLETLLPERLVRYDEDERTLLHRLFFTGNRFLNNTSISTGLVKEIIHDSFSSTGKLEFHSSDHVFEGTQNFLFENSIESGGSTPRTKFNDVARSPTHPAIPGMQEKVACNLDENGVLTFADNKPFTHILKLAGMDLHRPMAAGEWFCLSLLSAAEVNTVAFALTDIDGIGPSILVERFDICDHGSSELKIFEDFCSLLNVPIHKRYNSVDLSQIGQYILLHSAENKQDALQFFKQVVGSYLVGNMDGHTRNFGMISTQDKSTDDSGRSWLVKRLHAAEKLKMRLAPAYDVVSTTSLPNVSMAPSLPMAGSSVHDIEAMIKLAERLYINQGAALKIIETMSIRMQEAAKEILADLPECITKYDDVVSHLKNIESRVRRSTEFLLKDIKLSESKGVMKCR